MEETVDRASRAAKLVIGVALAVLLAVVLWFAYKAWKRPVDVVEPPVTPPGPGGIPPPPPNSFDFHGYTRTYGPTWFPAQYLRVLSGGVRMWNGKGGGGKYRVYVHDPNIVPLTPPTFAGITVQLPIEARGWVPVTPWICAGSGAWMVFPATPARICDGIIIVSKASYPFECPKQNWFNTGYMTEANGYWL